MNGTRKIEIFAPFSAALDLTKLILFQPFDLGKWCVIGKHLVQPTLDPRVCILFGDREWTDYDFSVEAQRISGTDQFALKFDPSRRSL